MKVPEEYLGQLVAIQLARPVYIYDYAAHVRLLVRDKVNEEMIMLQHVMVPNVKDAQELAALQLQNVPIPMREATMDKLQAVQVVAIADDSVTVEMMMPSQDGTTMRVVRKTIPSSLILSCDRMVEFDRTPPEVTQKSFAVAPDKPRVQLR